MTVWIKLELKFKILIVDPEKFESIYLNGNTDKDDLDNAPSNVFDAVKQKEEIDNTDLLNFSQDKKIHPSSNDHSQVAHSTPNMEKKFLRKMMKKKIHRLSTDLSKI